MSRVAFLAFVSITTLALATVTSPLRAASRGTGLGFILGEPNGLSGKFWLGNTTALDAALAWSTFDDEDALHLQIDHVWHDFGLLDVDKGSLPVYYGIGGRVAFHRRRDQVGVRFPLGMAYLFKSRRADIFMEVAPTLDLSPDTNVDVEGGFGVRYFFR